MIASNWSADNAPELIVLSGKDRSYHTSVGSTLDKEAVSTTGSGCFLPNFTAKEECVFQYEEFLIYELGITNVLTF